MLRADWSVKYGTQMATLSTGSRVRGRVISTELGAGALLTPAGTQVRRQAIAALLGGLARVPRAVAGQAAGYVAGRQAHPHPQGVHPRPRYHDRSVMRLLDCVRVLGFVRLHGGSVRGTRGRLTDAADRDPIGGAHKDIPVRLEPATEAERAVAQHDSGLIRELVAARR